MLSNPYKEKESKKLCTFNVEDSIYCIVLIKCLKISFLLLPLEKETLCGHYYTRFDLEDLSMCCTRGKNGSIFLCELAHV
jgi:hypothetical protein